MKSSTKKSLSLDVQKLESLLVGGEGDKVKEVLLGLSLPAVQEKLRVPLANLARRLGLPLLALKLLSPLVKNETHPEKLETTLRISYGAALVAVGANKWGRFLLETVSETQFPQVLLFRAFSHLNDWQTDLAEPLLESFSGSKFINDHERLTGRLNLAAAFVGNGKWDQGAKLLTQLKAEAHKQNKVNILGSCCELEGQIDFHSGSLVSATKSFTEAVELLKSSPGLPLLWARKWLAIANCKKTGSDEQMKAVRGEALTLMDFETVRDCDQFLGILKSDQALLKKVFFGTPYLGFRSRMIRLGGGQIAEFWDQSFTDADFNSLNEEFDVFEGRLQKGRPSLEFGQQSHQILFHLASDLYRPQSLVSIFGHLFPAEYFDPFSSGVRIQTAMHRLREDLKLKKIDFAIRLRDGKLHLNKKQMGLHFSRPIQYDKFVDLFFEKLKFTFGNSKFTSGQVGKLFDANPRASQRLIKTYKEMSLMKSFGSGSRTQYWIP